MAIGEFGGAPAAAADHGPMYAAPAYWLYEMSQAALNPARAFADAGRLFFKNPANPLVAYRRSARRSPRPVELFERSTRRYGKPEWHIDHTAGRRRARAGAHLRRSGSGRSAGSCISSARSSIRRAGRSRRC